VLAPELYKLMSSYFQRPDCRKHTTKSSAMITKLQMPSRRLSTSRRPIEPQTTPLIRNAASKRRLCKLSSDPIQPLAGAHRVIVVDKCDEWPAPLPGVEVMSLSDYLQRVWTPASRGLHVYNLCSKQGYQSSGYYASLLASAHGHQILPSASTLNDMRLQDLPHAVQSELQVLAKKCLFESDGPACTMSIFFGRSRQPARQELASFLFYFFPSPLLRVRFEFDGLNWQIACCERFCLGEVCQEGLAWMVEAAQQHMTIRHADGSARLPRSRQGKRYNLAVLVNDHEEQPPSNPAALAAFEKAAKDIGMSVRFLQKADAHHVAEHDALLIRETTAVNNHTYEIASKAQRSGLVVIDDPESILRCCNKVFLAQLLKHHAIEQPDTLIINRGNLHRVRHLLGFPCVVKLPDSQFSRGVVKVHDEEELHHVCGEMLRQSDLLVAQRYEYTAFDWRVGVLDGVPLYACRYYMVDGHWQVYRRDKSGAIYEGRHDTLNLADVPESVVRMAVTAANAVGRGLYGVDLKQYLGSVKVIEVNDNPSIDAGVEDEILGAKLYRSIMAHFIKRLDATHHLP